MLQVVAESTPLSAVSADVLAVPVFKGGIQGPGTTAVLTDLGLDDLPRTPSFRGDRGQTLRLAAPGRPFSAVLLVGLGRMDAVTPALLREAAGLVAAQTRRERRVVTTLAEVHASRATIEAIAEGFHLGSYRDRRFRGAGSAPGGEEEPADATATILVPSSLLAEARAACDRAATVAAATCLARDLVNAPPATKRPPDLAATVAEAAEAAGLRVTIHDETWLEAHSCGGLLAVGRGSPAPPRLVELVYEPASPLGHVVVVGKGITFDSGGLNLKPAASMPAMKGDMAGAAAVAAAMTALADLGVRVKVTGLLALAENAFGGDAQRPSDVIRMFDGTTVEVGHTDAEGRLVLADALAYGASLEPDSIVDLATLTGAAIQALGPQTAALLTDHDDLADALLAAAGAAGEPLWRLPLVEEMDRTLDSTVADVCNIGDPAGGEAITAALFLRRFVGDAAWAHIDMAGPAAVDKAHARGHLPVGGTGYGVATLLTWLEQRAG